MKRLLLWGIVAHGVALLGAGAAHADCPACAGAIDTLKPEFQQQADKPDIPGISVAVGLGDEVIWAQGFGEADLEMGVAVTPETKFRIGSVSKVVTMAGLARLYERGEIKLDTPIQTYLPDYPQSTPAITLRLLVSHAAGIRHYKGDEFLSAKPYANMAESLTIFKDDPLLFTPGAKMSYSTYAWTVVSAAMEKASAREFLALLQAEVFDPLNMNNTVADQSTPIIPNRARPYQADDEQGLVNAPYVDNSYKWAAGGILSTPSDVVRFALAHARPGYLKAETLVEMFTNQRLSDGSENSFGLGWRVGLDGAEERIARILGDAAAVKRLGKVVHHSGGSVGGSTMLFLNPKAKLAVMVTSNRSSGSGYVYTLALKTLAAMCHAAQTCHESND